MAETTLVLVQREGSPLAELLERALELAAFGSTSRATRPPLPKAAFRPEALVVWDLWDFPGEELESMARELAPEEAGVVVACAEVDEACRRALRLSGALALVFLRQPPEAVAAVLELAAGVHSRLAHLHRQREELRQALADRELIEKAKRLLIAAKGYSEAEAMRRLQRYARNTNQRLVKVAESLISGYEIFGHPVDED
jgi:response regulator NasT